MICSLPGSGKTTLSKKLAEKKRTIRLCPDEWIISLGMSDRYLDAKHRPIVEELQWEIALDMAKNGANVVLENGYWTAENRIGYADSAKKEGIKTELHFLDIDLEELSRRIEHRNKNLPKFSLKVSQKELTRWHEKFQAPTIQELNDNYDKYKIYKS